MDEARGRIDWETMFKLALDPNKARLYREKSSPELEDTCTMCGELCAARKMKQLQEEPGALAEK